jgi:Family of unknown function (DUF6527)
MDSVVSWTLRIFDSSQTARDSTGAGRLRAAIGAMWRTPGMDIPDRPPAYDIVLPNNAGIWNTNERGNFWMISGEAPKITVEPSINAEPNWHGFIRDGRMI